MSKYGSREGLAERLNEWATQLGRDKKYPWIGTGIIDDLRAAASAINGEPTWNEVFADKRKTEHGTFVTEKSETVEYDL